MQLQSLELVGFKSFAKKTELEFSSAITGIVGPNGSGKSNVAEAFRFVLGEQSIKSMRGKRGEDLIFSGSTSAPRMNRAGVKLVFDNPATGDGKRLLNIDFDQVSIERVVHRDGTNEYLINGSKVRLRDVVELLAGANIGASGHHIISQGEADRVLSASPKERRSMIEDALALRVYQYKKEESQRKLEKTEENRKQVEALRKENAPHLKFLEKQVEKVKKAVELKDDLVNVYAEYLAREQIRLSFQEKNLKEQLRKPEHELHELAKHITDAKESLARSSERDKERDALLSVEEKLRETRKERDQLSRDLGRLEGEIAAEERRLSRAKAEHTGEVGSVPLSDVRHLADTVSARITEVEREEDVSVIRTTLLSVRDLVREFIEMARHSKDTDVSEAELARLEKEKKHLEHTAEKLAHEEKELDHEYARVRKTIEARRDEGQEAERELFRLMNRETEVRQIVMTLRSHEAELERGKEDWKREVAEAGALLGHEALLYKTFTVMDKHGHPVSEEDIVGEDASVQHDRRRTLEKMKIRLEELGGGATEDIMREYQEVRTRDEFLARELVDLEKSEEVLEELIKNLELEIDKRFKEGIVKISDEFNRFFTLMFGGGNAILTLVKEERRKKGLISSLLGDEIPEEGDEEESEGEEGVDVSVSLPNKKVKGLAMLSGGERALTSIALIFAMSQVNPPPFLILDETDAALDEANSRRYGDMIERLSKKSQLILITHNRETMSRAGILYGVTMGSDAVSKLLSVKFEEAVAVAK